MRWGGGEGAQEWAREIAGAREWDWMGTRESIPLLFSLKQHVSPVIVPIWGNSICWGIENRTIIASPLTPCMLDHLIIFQRRIL